MLAVRQTSLSAGERALLEAFVDELRRREPETLSAVWLFGSRARGEPAAHGDSDVDVLVIVDGASWNGHMAVNAMLHECAQRLGLERLTPWFSVHVETPDWLAQRREIRSFFIGEVDRDKVVLYERAR